MQDLEIIKEFLRSKDGYLKCGNLKIHEALLKRYPGNTFDIDVIRKAKKEVKKEYKNLVAQSKPIKIGPAKVVASAELLAKFNELAKQMGLQELIPVTSEEDKLEGFLKRKKALRDYTVPSIKDQVGMHILLGCNHVPFHHKQLHRGILEMIKDNAHSIKGFHLMGDFLDLNPLSFHDNGKFTAIPGLTLQDEYDAGQELLYDFDTVLPKGIWKTYLYGNHENRYNRWMASMNNAKTPLISPEDGLGLWARGYQVKNKWDQDFFTIGNDFDIFHGIYFSIHNAKAHLDKLRRSCAYVHTHRIQNYHEGSMAAYNIGGCADFNSPSFNYASRPMKSQWANGFAIDMVDDKGRSHVTQIKATPDGHFYFGGKLY